MAIFLKLLYNRVAKVAYDFTNLVLPYAHEIRVRKILQNIYMPHKPLTLAVPSPRLFETHYIGN